MQNDRKFINFFFCKIVFNKFLKIIWHIKSSVLFKFWVFWLSPIFISHAKLLFGYYLCRSVLLILFTLFASAMHLVMPVPVAARSKTWVCDSSPAEIVVSNPTGGMDVCLL